MGELVSCSCARTARATGQVSVVTAGSMSQPQTSLPLPKVMYVVTPPEAEDVVPDAWGAGTRLARRCAYTAVPGSSPGTKRCMVLPFVS